MLDPARNTTRPAARYEPLNWQSSQDSITFLGHNRAGSGLISGLPGGLPSGAGGVLMGMLPFWVFGAAYLTIAACELGWLAGASAGLVRTIPLIAYGLVSIGLIVCWVMGFPPYSLAYLGMGLYFGNSTSNTVIYGARYGLQGWLPLLTGLVVGLLISRSWVPLVRLLFGIWNDWTRLSFGIYAYLLPLMSITFFDTDWGERHFYGLLFDSLLIAAGAAAFLRIRTTLKRVMALQLVVALILVRGVWMGAWQGGLNNLAALDLPGMLLVYLLWGGLMLVPSLIGLLRVVEPWIGRR